jgi:hypothetical protein
MTLQVPRPLVDILALGDTITRDGNDSLADENATEGALGDGLWDPQRAPCGAVLVDLLINIDDHLDQQRKPIRVAIIVSAWDTMEGMGLTPEDWFARSVALLDQFVRANPESFEVAVYGISAQGGDIADPTIRAKLLRLRNPMERVRLTRGHVVDHDLTSPIVWLLRGGVEQ